MAIYESIILKYLKRGKNAFLLSFCIIWTSCGEKSIDSFKKSEFLLDSNNNNVKIDTFMKVEKTYIRNSYNAEECDHAFNIMPDNWYVLIEQNYQDSYAPSDSFYYKNFEFHSNGILKSSDTYLFNTLAVGISKKFDENGLLIEETNRDIKYFDFNVKPKDLVVFLENEGWYNRETGETFTLRKNEKSGIFTSSIFDAINVKLNMEGEPTWSIIVSVNPTSSRIPNLIIDKYGERQTDGTIDFKHSNLNVTIKYYKDYFAEFIYEINANTGEYNVTPFFAQYIY